jgi:uncharacterized cupredoxin-like copper-binding protein
MNNIRRSPSSIRGIAAAGTITVLAGLGLGVGTAQAATVAKATSVVKSKPPTVTTVLVTEKEYSIVLSKKSFKAGKYLLKVTNQGRMAHDLVVSGPGVTRKATASLAAGKTGNLSVTLKHGTYELWCAMPGHKALGMDIKIKVS